MGKSGRRRRTMVDDNEWDDELGEEPMSPNTLKKHHQMKIMQADLGNATADHIKTSDYGKSQALGSNFPIVRKCDLKGTQEAKLASQNKEQANAWKTWGQTDEAFETSFGERPVGNGNTHRSNMANRIREEEARIGRAMTVEDTYDERGWKRPNGQTGSIMAPPPPKSSQKTASSKGASGQAAPAPKRVRRAAQPRVWPPPGLLGTPSFPGTAKPAIPSTSTATKHSGMPKKISETSAARARARPLQQRSALTLVEGPQFMSSANSLIASWSQKTGAQINDQGHNAASAAATQQASTGMSNAPVTEEPKKALIPNDGSIRKVPVEEFSFPLANALNLNEVSTHTDGAPSPAELSGFSTSVISQDVGLMEEGSLDNGLVGLGIRFDASPSHSGSIMDSPILDDVNSDVLLADNTTATAKVVTFNGGRFVAESEFLRLKQLLESKSIADAQSGSTAAGVPNEPVSQSFNFKVEAAPQRSLNPFATVTWPVLEDPQASIKPATMPAPQPSLNPFAAVTSPALENQHVSVKPVAMPAPKPSLTSTTATSSTMSRSMGHVNPFSPREPLSSNDTNVATAVQSIPARRVPQLTPAQLAAVALASGPAPVVKTPTRPQQFLPSKWATAPPEEPSRIPPAKPKPAKDSRAPLFGDRRVFGHLSDDCARPKQYNAPPLQSDSNRGVGLLGAGYDVLVEDLKALTVDGQPAEQNELRQVEGSEEEEL